MDAGVRFGGELKLLHHVAAGQVVAATSIDDHSARTLFDDTLCVGTMCAADLFRLLHLRAQHALHNEALLAVSFSCINVLLGSPHFLYGQSQAMQVYLHQVH